MGGRPTTIDYGPGSKSPIVCSSIVVRRNPPPSFSTSSASVVNRAGNRSMATDQNSDGLCQATTVFLCTSRPTKRVQCLSASAALDRLSTGPARAAASIGSSIDGALGFGKLMIYCFQQVPARRDNSLPSNGWQYPRLDEGKVLNTRRAVARQSGHSNFGLTVV